MVKKPEKKTATPAATPAATDLSKYQTRIDDPEECFGKLFEADNPDCLKCDELTPCGEAFAILLAGAGVDEQIEVEEKPEAKKPEAKKPEAKKPEEKVETPKPGKAKAAPAKKVEPAKAAPKTNVEKDVNGFKVGSKSSKIYNMLLAGKYTKKEMIGLLDKEYPGANNATTLGVFIGDLQKPVGTYSTSRGIVILKSGKDVLSIKK